MDDLYRENILEHYKRPHHWGELEDPDMEFYDTNPLCGDELKVQIKLADDGTVSDVAFSGHGCAISQAAASMTSDELIGMPKEKLLELDREFVLDLVASLAAVHLGGPRATQPGNRAIPPADRAMQPDTERSQHDRDAGGHPGPP